MQGIFCSSERKRVREKSGEVAASSNQRMSVSAGRDSKFYYRSALDEHSSISLLYYAPAMPSSPSKASAGGKQYKYNNYTALFITHLSQQ